MTLADMLVALGLILKHGHGRLRDANAQPVNGPVIPSEEFLCTHPEKIEEITDAVLTFGSQVDRIIEGMRWRSAKIAEQKALHKEALETGVPVRVWVPIPENTSSEQRAGIDQALAEMRTAIDAHKAQRAQFLKILERRDALRTRFCKVTVALGRDMSNFLPKDLREALVTVAALDRAEEMIEGLEKTLEKRVLEEKDLETQRAMCRRSEAERAAMRGAMVRRYDTLPAHLREEFPSKLLRMGAGYESLRIAEEELTLLEKKAHQPIEAPTAQSDQRNQTTQPARKRSKKSADQMPRRAE